MEPVGLKRYMLIRVALDVEEGKWFGELVGQSQSERQQGGGKRKEVVGQSEKAESVQPQSWNFGEELPGRAIIPEGGRHNLLYRLLYHRQKREKRQGSWADSGKAEAQRREKLLQERRERIREIERQIERLRTEIMSLAGEDSSFYCVYEEVIRKTFKINHNNVYYKDAGDRNQEVLSVLWRNRFDWKEFDTYDSLFWAGLLMSEAVLPHFVILGTASCIPELAEEYACRMKSLKWILREADYSEEMQDFVEDFYTEYGLAVSLQTVPDGAELRRLRLTFDLPSNILDFTRETGPNVTPAEGSIWIDMWSREEKRRRILGRCRGITYVSLKEKWKYAQRRCNSPRLP